MIKDNRMLKEEGAFRIAGIGASAGGLESLSGFFEALPADTNIAYVLVTHLDPKHKSNLSDILSKSTSMPVIEVEDGVKVEPNSVYVIPPNTAMTISGGILKLTRRTKEDGQYLTIDHFLISLAKDQGKNAFGIILSGAASDGSNGIRAIKEAGGINFAQNEESARYPSMPHYAISTDCVDFILPPKDIALKIKRISESIYGKNARKSLINEEDDLNEVFAILDEGKKIDFSKYKPSTVRRRTERRMLLNQINNYNKYVELLRSNSAEREALYQDLLIGVTEFFRDEERFEYLKIKVFPDLVKNRKQDEPIRVWVAGCSTGEEAYSIAIYLLEFLKDKKLNIPVQIFASDVNRRAISIARRGVYPSRISSYVSQERLNEFFIQKGENYQINKLVRQLCIFAEHDLIKDPPFSKVDLIMCSNVLIYMDQDLQKKILSRFHYALSPGGKLVLGKSEGIGSLDYFHILDKKHRIYEKKNVASRADLRFSPTNLPKKYENAMINKVNKTHPQNTSQEVTEILLSRYAPASIVVNDSMEITEFRGQTERYIKHPPGQASLNLFKMAPENLVLELRALIHQVKKKDSTVVRDNISIAIDGQQRKLKIEVIKLKDQDMNFLILFEEEGRQVSSPQPRSEPQEVSKDEQVLRLEQELNNTKKYLHTIIKEQEIQNEEQKAVNEELLSSNEELQSLNEELETSKEEIESTNEELLTVNEELQTSNEQLREARDYAQTIVETIREPLLILDNSLRIKSANASFYKTYRVTQEMTEGELLYNIGNNQWDIPDLRRVLEQVLPKTMQFADYEVTHNFPVIGKRTMLLNAKKMESQQLILLALEDITEKKALEKHKKELQKKDIKRRDEMEHRKNEFISIASHELKTPITSIKAYTQIIQSRLKKNSPDGSMLELLRKMDLQLNDLTSLIDDLLNDSKIRSGKLRIDKKNTDFTALVKEVVGDMQKITRTHTISLVGKAEGSVMIDAYRIKQVLNNLLSNAIKYSPQANQVIVRMSSETDKVLVSVEDHGIGIAEDHLSRVFDPYYRVDQASGEQFPGLGLGLRIAREIVEQHKGRIWVTSKKGKGSTFFMSLPR